MAPHAAAREARPRRADAYAHHPVVVPHCPHRASGRGWQISPDRFETQDLANVWLAQ